MDMVQSLLCCFPRSAPTPPRSLTESSNPSKEAEAKQGQIEELSFKIVHYLHSAPRDKNIKHDLDGMVSATGWSEMLARNVLAMLKQALDEGRDKMGPALRDAFERALDEATACFHDLVREAKDHPAEAAAAVLLTVLALGVLVVMAPYVLELLGFGELGPTAGTFASWWESTYSGYIPAGSLFSYFQRLGMLWGRA